MQIILGALLYTVITFFLSFLRHSKLFVTRYTSWEYTGKHRSRLLGLLAIGVQGLLVSYLYASAYIDHSASLDALYLAFTLCSIVWARQVLGAMAKYPALRNAEFVIYETVYLILQFGLFGVLVSAIVY